MDAPVTVIESIATLLKPYGIDFREMWRREQSAQNDQADPDELMTLKAAADFAKVSVWTVRRWCRKGVVSRKTSQARCGRILISKRSLIKFLENLPC